VGLLLCSYRTITVPVFENPSEAFGGLAVVWLQDHNCVCLKILQRLLVGLLLCSYRTITVPVFENPAEAFGGLAVVWLQDHNCTC
jgi:hypothetical protein